MHTSVIPGSLPTLLRDATHTGHNHANLTAPQGYPVSIPAAGRSQELKLWPTLIDELVRGAHKFLCAVDRMSVLPALVHTTSSASADAAIATSTMSLRGAKASGRKQRCWVFDVGGIARGGETQRLLGAI